jgi:hypothetical protein
MLQDVMFAQCVQSPSRTVLISRQGKPIEQSPNFLANIQSCLQCGYDFVEREVASIMGEELVVCERVEHRTWASRWTG